MTNQFDILFEPLQIGPVTAPNRFYQVPHCNGMGHRNPQALAAMRGMKAEGGWGVVCTEETEIHYTSDLSPYNEGRLWADEEIPRHALVVEAIHEHDSLAGIQLVHNGRNSANLYARIPPLGPRSMSVASYDPVQTRRMDKEDFRNFRRWHRAAAIRAQKAGYDIVYCYAGHGLTLPMHMLSRRYNDRTDEYGGSLENRVRLFREIIEDTKEAVGDTCAVVVRFAVDELLGEDGLTHQGEGYDVVAMLAELPDLWDVNISAWPNDSATSRYEKEGFQEKYIGFVKSLTSKPVVGVGRYTSPQSMLSAIQRGVVDLIGAARPSIADPFLPRKIKEGRIEDIRECIGCNICVSSDLHIVHLRCTQNPTMGEAWRRDWHAETIKAKTSEEEVLVIGGGPAGLECARALGQRGYPVTLLEAKREVGGRVLLESVLPGLIEWRRVLDWRLTQIEKMPNVEIYPSSPMQAGDVLESGIGNVIVATGAQWRRDGIGRTLWQPVPGSEEATVFTSDDLMAGRVPTGRVVVFDDDHFYMSSVLIDLLAEHGCQITLVTPAAVPAYWTQFTLEQGRVHQRFAELGVEIYTQHTLHHIQAEGVELTCLLSGRIKPLAADAVLTITERIPNDALYTELKPKLAEGQLRSLRVIGDAEAPNIIAQAVYAGHLAAREFDEISVEGVPFKVERTVFG